MLELGKIPTEEDAIYNIFIFGIFSVLNDDHCTTINSLHPGLTDQDVEDSGSTIHSQLDNRVGYRRSLILAVARKIY